MRAKLQLETNSLENFKNPENPDNSSSVALVIFPNLMVKKTVSSMKLKLNFTWPHNETWLTRTWWHRTTYPTMLCAREMLWKKCTEMNVKANMLQCMPVVAIGWSGVESSSSVKVISNVDSCYIPHYKFPIIESANGTAQGGHKCALCWKGEQCVRNNCVLNKTLKVMVWYQFKDISIFGSCYFFGGNISSFWEQEQFFSEIWDNLYINRQLQGHSLLTPTPRTKC